MNHAIWRRSRLLLVSCAFILLCTGTVHAATSHSPFGRSAPIFANVQISNDTFRAHSEPTVAENPRNASNLIAASKQFTDTQRYRFKIGTYYSRDGGRTWHDNGMLQGFDAYTSVSDVTIAFARNGTAYLSLLACSGNGVCPGTSVRSGIFVLRSTDGGKTWSQPVAVYLDTSGASFNDKPWITVDTTTGTHSGTIYVAWNLDSLSDPCSSAGADGPKAEAQQGGIAVSRSTDGGQTFSVPIIVAPFTTAGEGLGAVPQVGPSGKVTVVYSHTSCDTGDPDSVDAVTSTDGGESWTNPLPISNVVPLPGHLPNGTFRNFTMPAFVISPRTGTMVIAWSDMRNGDADILSSRSINGGATWSKPYRVNHDQLHNGKDQFQPALAVAPDGTITCAWFDRRYDPANKLIDEEIAQSTDGGKTFGHNFRVTAKSWDPGIDAPLPEGNPGNTFIGDYQGLAVDNASVHPVWNDTQDGASQEIRTAVLSVKVLRRY